MQSDKKIWFLILFLWLMKNLNFIMLLFLSVLFGCTNVDDLQTVEDSHQQVKNSLSKEEAIKIANKVLKRNSSTRLSLETQVSFDFVVSNGISKTRSVSVSDTLAYIINYPNDDGFVIVSTCRNVFPVLGFSDKGHFSLDNENAKLNFIDKIEDYTLNASTNEVYDADDGKYGICYYVTPTIKISLHQLDPWNKYVLKEHPDCPVGCVAIATALTLSHTMLELNYHGSTYYFKSIIEAINKEQNQNGDLGGIYADDEWNNAVQPTYTYAQAVDSMAKLLYWIGKDLKISYNPSGSSANSWDAYALCKQLKEDSELEYSDFNIEAITWLIKNGYMVYLNGRNTNGKEGHAWVSDGVAFCVESDNNDKGLLKNEKITETYIHCDWGWDGYCNGFFSGSVFKTSNGDFRPNKYFALRRGKNNMLFPIH